MSSKTKIVVLHMKEIIYTAIFIVLGIFLAFLLFFMFGNGKSSPTNNEVYQPGIYTSSVTLSNATLEVEVSVDENNINSIRFTNLDEDVATAYPLVQPSMEDIATQICDTQSFDNLSFSDDNVYTSQVIVDAIKTAVNKAELEH